MPPRKGKRVCLCNTCGGKLVEENVWYSHQTPILPASRLSAPSSDVLLDPLPSDTVVCKTNPQGESTAVNTESRAIAREKKRDAKRERSRYTQRAAAGLNACLSKANEVLRDLPGVETHEDLDRLQSRIDKICIDLASITRQTASLEQLRHQVHHRIGAIDSMLLGVKEKLGERRSPIPVHFGKLSPSSIIQPLKESHRDIRTTFPRGDRAFNVFSASVNALLWVESFGLRFFSASRENSHHSICGFGGRLCRS